MTARPRVTAIVGTYRKGHVIDAAVDEILAAAREAGAETEKIYLIDKHVEFCTNCRTCTQGEGPRRGNCTIQDDMQAILEQIDRSDSLVLASPMNFWTVTAVTKRFIERLVCYAYWPWGGLAPKQRNKLRQKRAVLVVSSAAPAPLIRLMTRMVGLMKGAAGLFGARTVGVLLVGLAAGEERADIGPRAKRKAQQLGRKLAVRIAPRA
jgi:multimeric flavodoxin WrbA